MKRLLAIGIEDISAALIFLLLIAYSIITHDRLL